MPDGITIQQLFISAPVIAALFYYLGGRTPGRRFADKPDNDRDHTNLFSRIKTLEEKSAAQAERNRAVEDTLAEMKADIKEIKSYLIQTK